MVSFGHVHIVFDVHVNSSGVHGRHDVWVIRIYAQCLESSACHCGVMLSLRSNHESMFRLTVWTCDLMAHS